MNTLRFTTTMLPMLVLCQLPATAGVLRDFEDDASSGKSESSNDDDDDSESCLLCDIIGAMLSDDNDDDYNYDDRRTTYTPIPAYSSPSAYSGPSEIDMEFQVGFRHGFWGRDFYGNQAEVLLSMNSLLLGIESTWDAEKLSQDKVDHMNTSRMRAGVTVGEEFRCMAMAGFSVLSGQMETGFFSARLGMEYLGKHGGARVVWDGDFGETMGFQDLQAVGVLKKGPVELNAGYRFRVTNGQATVMIHGPQVGIGFRF